VQQKQVSEATQSQPARLKINAKHR